MQLASLSPEIDSAFTLPAYIALLDALRQQGFSFTDYDRLQPQRPEILLRHDIDMSLDYAAAMGRAEQKMGISAWYFVLVRSALYGLHAPRQLALLLELQNQGHKIGLHFDASQYGNDPARFDTAVADECRWLEDLTGRPVTMVSFHRPAPELRGYDALLAGRLHTYMPRFFSMIGYCSDSRGVWVAGPPDTQAAVQNRTAMQLLIHPIWWCAPGCNPEQKLTAWLMRHEEAYRQELASNCAVFNPARSA